MSRAITDDIRGCWKGILARCAGLLGESGQALVENALVISFLGIPLLCGTFDMATLIYGNIEVANAAHAGAIYGMLTVADATDTTGITNAAEAELKPDFAAAITAGTVIVTPSIFYVCSNAQSITKTGNSYGFTTTYSTLTAARAVCASGTATNHPLEYIQVQVQAPLTLPFHCCGLPNPVTLSSTSMAEVEDLP
jgi:Flp pilus assembly protein TadG